MPFFPALTLLPGRGKHIGEDADPATRNYRSQTNPGQALGRRPRDEAGTDVTKTLQHPADLALQACRTLIARRHE